MTSRLPPGHFDLLEDLDQPGCPACRAARRSADRLIADILSESVNDPAVRPRLRASHGFCPPHAHAALRLAGPDGQGIALLYGDFLRHIRGEAEAAAAAVGRRRWRRRAATAEAALSPHASCRACEVARGRAALYLELLARADAESELGRAARKDDRGLCVPHLAQGLDLAQGRRQAERLLELHIRAVERIHADLEEYLRKQDHRFSDEPKGREQGSWRRAVLWLAGLPPGGSDGGTR
ncbi:MAG TPA: DUF6062 family protein [Egibacteraceae bacterium]|nr:DUF6062 family protein [Egibacteraceae bacterium]